MTLTQNERAELIKHRVEKSRSLHNEALFLFNSGLYNTAVNRIYYAMYHAVSALALKDSFTTSKHLQLIGWFNREYVKTGRTDINSGKYLTRAFEMRSSKISSIASRRLFFASSTVSPWPLAPGISGHIAQYPPSGADSIIAASSDFI